MNVFETATIGGIEVRNRIFRSATHESCALPGGHVSPSLTKTYQALSEGGVGLIITGFFSFSAIDNPSGATVLIDSDEKVPELKELTDMVHENGAKIIPQLAHVGSQLSYPPTKEVFAPSAVTDPINGIQPKPFTTEQIQLLITEFGQAALRAKQAGFDGVQLHGAHGYLLSKFLSPVYNKRTDEYGGSPEKNAKIIVDILKEIKSRCGKDFPVWIKLNGSDFSKEAEGYDQTGFLIAARLLADNGIDAIEVSGGTMTGAYSPCRSKKHEAYHLDLAVKLKKEVDLPLILVGGLRSIEKIEEVIHTPEIDAVSLSRPLIKEPDLVKSWASGLRKESTCIACNGCFNPNGTCCMFTLEGDALKAQKKMVKILNARRK